MALWRHPLRVGAEGAKRRFFRRQSLRQKDRDAGSSVKGCRSTVPALIDKEGFGSLAELLCLFGAQFS